MKNRWLLWVLAFVAGASLVVGCGDDDDSTVAEDDTEEEGDFCSGYLELNAGEPTAEKLREVAASAPGDAKKALEDVADGFEKDGESYFEGPEFGKNFATVSRIAADECADGTLDVSAAEYAFNGIPESVDAGVVAVNLKNMGKEFHELVLFRRSDDTDKTFDEILALGEEEAQGLMESKGGSFAEPGGKMTGIFDLEQAGDYMAVCFIPVGTTPENEEADGPPHFTRGMKVEFTVE